MNDSRSKISGAKARPNGFSPKIDFNQLRAAVKVPWEGAESRTWWSIDDLVQADFPAPQFVLDGLLPEGLTILGGRPKLGKSILALNLALVVMGVKFDGSPFLDRHVERGNVLYLALEDGKRRLSQRATVMGYRAGDGEHNLNFATAWDPLQESESLDRLKLAVEQHAAKLVVIDTFSRITSTNLDQLKPNDMTRALAPLQQYAVGEGISILVIDHIRKNDTIKDPVMDVLGSTAKAGVPDTIMGLYRERNENTATLVVTGRDVEEQRLALELDAPSLWWRYLGDADEQPRSTAEAQILAALQKLGGEGRADQVAPVVKKSRQAVSLTLRRLADHGLVTRAEEQTSVQGRPRHVYRVNATSF